MYRIKVWIPVDVEPEEDTLYATRKEAEEELEHDLGMQPENRYEIEEVEG